MSLVVTVYVPSGVVMAADSRMTALRSEQRDEGGKKVQQQQQLVLSDSAYKIVMLEKARAGMALYDASLIENVPVDTHVRRFEEEVLENGDDVTAVARKFQDYMEKGYKDVPVGFHVAGYLQKGRTSVPYVLAGHTVRDPVAGRMNATEDGTLRYGVVRSGDDAVVNRLIDDKSLPLFWAMPLQDAIDYAVHLIRSTIDTMRFEPRFPSVGGPIDVLVVKPDGMQWVQRKELRGER